MIITTMTVLYFFKLLIMVVYKEQLWKTTLNTKKQKNATKELNKRNHPLAEDFQHYE